MKKQICIKKPSQTKIIATMGPACTSKDVLRKLFIEGVDLCRLNFSHGSYEDHYKSMQLIWELNEELGSNVAIIADLQGPKLRIGEVENNHVDLVEGEIVEFICSKPFVGNAKKLYMSYPEFPNDVKVGETIMVDDGKLRFEVTKTNKKNTVAARVLTSGVLSSKKGVNLPDTKISQPCMTPKDIADAEFALEHNVDWIALSFVRNASDIIELKNLIRKKKKNAGIIAKIEKPEALLEIDEIIDATNAIMVARGDLGVEVPFDRVPLIQKDIIKRCIAMGKPVIVATQMMESMITSYSPTRAEVNDVANAVLDGADAVMLSAETSVGKYPIHVIQCMQQIIDYTEKNGYCFNRQHAPDEFNRTFVPDSLCNNASVLANQTKASAIVVFTHSGYTAFRISSHRPSAPIYAFTNNKNILRKLSLLWGVRAFYMDTNDHIEKAIDHSISFMKKTKFIKDDDIIVHVGSAPFNKKGQTNMIQLSYV